MNDVGHAPLPGDVLLHQYLQPNNITMYRLAKAMNLPQTTISGIIRGKRRITTSLAYHLAYVLGTSPEYWLELQMHYDIENYDKFNESGLTVLIDNTVGDTVQSERWRAEESANASFVHAHFDGLDSANSFSAAAHCTAEDILCRRLSLYFLPRSG